MHTKAKGDMAETTCARFLERHRFRILARNYRKKWGELDIVAFKDGVLHFFEVKSTTVSRTFGLRDNHRLEDNVHQTKLASIRRMIQTYMVEMRQGTDAPFYFHVLAVRMDIQRHKAAIRWIKNVVL